MIAYYLLIIKIRLKFVQLKIEICEGINMACCGASSNALSGGPYRIEEFSDFELEPIALARQRFRR
jgi:hypothetical protein